MNILKTDLKAKIEQALIEYEKACFATPDRRIEEVPGQTHMVIDAIWPDIEKALEEARSNGYNDGVEAESYADMMNHQLQGE